MSDGYGEEVAAYEVRFLCWLILASVTDQKWLSLICAAIACGYSLLGLLSIFREVKNGRRQGGEA